MRRPVPGVYAIRNTINGRAYVGGTVDLDKRLKAHRGRLQRGSHSRQLQADWDHYGADAFTFEVLETVSTSAQLGAAEIHWQNVLNLRAPIYNSGDGRDHHHHQQWVAYRSFYDYRGVQSQPTKTD